MPISPTNVLKLGGSGVAIVFAIALIFEVMGGESGVSMMLYMVLIVAGLAAAIIGWLLERRKGSAGSESAGSESSDS